MLRKRGKREGARRHEKSAASAAAENVVGARVVLVCVCAPEERKERRRKWEGTVPWYLPHCLSEVLSLLDPSSAKTAT